MDSARVYTGLDNIHLADEYLKDQRIGLMTNQTGVDRRLVPGIDIIAARYRLTALFACEHGVRGNVQAGKKLASYIDPDTGVPVYSVYGDSHHLSPEMLDAFDVFVFDMQDVGARFYTYLYSLSFAMESCAKAGKPVVILDRPNPIGGDVVQGTLLETKCASFVGEYPIPTRYSLTVGEYALWVRDYLKLTLTIHIIPMTGWRRDMRFEQTGLPWVAPSLNCATLHAAAVYTGTCVFEGTNVSEGRGTTLPFEMIGAPFINAVTLEKRMNERKLPGVAFRRAYFTPQFSKYSGETCAGVQIHILSAHEANPFEAGLMLLETIWELYPDQLEFTNWIPGEEIYSIDRILGTTDFRLKRFGARDLINLHTPYLKRFWMQAQPILLY